MDERKTCFDYLEHTIEIFGITMLILNVFCRLFGKEAAGYSSLFQLGNRGIACSTMLQFFAVSVVITGIRYILFTDRLIKRMSLIGRVVCMLVLVVVVIVVFSYKFLWFPVDEWMPWLMFFLSFAVCFVVSLIYTYLKERAENKLLEEALKKIQEGKHGV